MILREWDEREHRVTVNAHGQFEYEGQGFKSLTLMWFQRNSVPVDWDAQRALVASFEGAP